MGIPNETAAGPQCSYQHTAATLQGYCRALHDHDSEFIAATEQQSTFMDHSEGVKILTSISRAAWALTYSSIGTSSAETTALLCAAMHSFRVANTSCRRCSRHIQWPSTHAFRSP